MKNRFASIMVAFIIWFCSLGCSLTPKSKATVPEEWRNEHRIKTQSAPSRMSTSNTFPMPTEHNAVIYSILKGECYGLMNPEIEVIDQRQQDMLVMKKVHPDLSYLTYVIERKLR